MSTFKARVEDVVGSVGDDSFLSDALNDTLNDIIASTPPQKSMFMATTTYGGFGSILTVDEDAPTPSTAWEDGRTWYSISQFSSDGNGTGIRVNITVSGLGEDVEFVIVDGGTGYVIDEEITFIDPGSTEFQAVLVVATIQQDTSVDIETSRILSVFRNNANNKRTCKLATPNHIANMQNGNTDIENIFYPSSTYPSFSYVDGKLDVYPIITAGESIEVHHIQKPSVVFSDSVINNMPDEVESLLITGTAIRCINRLMTDIADPMDFSAPQFIPPDYPTDITPIDLTVDIHGNPLPVPILNASWSKTDQNFDPSTNAPEYTPPQVGGETESLTEAMIALTGDEYGVDADFLDFTKWFTAVGELIEDEEDPELAQIQISKIQAYIQTYSAQMQSNLNEFNQAVQRYQADMQDAFKDGELLGETNRQYLQTYQADIQTYQGAITSVVNQWEKNEMPKIQKWTTQYQNGLAEYQADIQNAQIEVASDLQAKQAKYQWYQVQLESLTKLFTTQLTSWGGAQQQQEQGA